MLLYTSPSRCSQIRRLSTASTCDGSTAATNTTLREPCIAASSAHPVPPRYRAFKPRLALPTRIALPLLSACTYTQQHAGTAALAFVNDGNRDQSSTTFTMSYSRGSAARSADMARGLCGGQTSCSVGAHDDQHTRSAAFGRVLGALLE